MLFLFSILEKHLLLLTSFLALTDWSKKKNPISFSVFFKKALFDSIIFFLQGIFK